jgi:hypothetical protein
MEMGIVVKIHVPIQVVTQNSFLLLLELYLMQIHCCTMLGICKGFWLETEGMTSGFFN